MTKYLVVVFVCLFLYGCETIPLNKDGEVQINKDTSVGMDDMGVGKVKNRF